MIAVFYGKDDFSAHEALASLRAELDSDGMLDENTTRIEGASAKPDELLAICQTLPFLSAKRLVIVDGLLRRFEPGAGGRRSRRKGEHPLGPWEAFVAGLAALPESTALVFLDGPLAKTNPFLSALEKLAQVREFAPLKQGAVAGWIRDRAEQRGIPLEARAIAALAALVGPHLWTLDSELGKLAMYAHGRSVTEEDVRALVSEARETNVFAMVDAAVEGRPKEALDALRRLLADGEAPQRLLAMVQRQLRLLILTRELLDQRARPADLAARLGQPHFVVQRLVQLAPSYGIDRLRAAYRRVLDADLSIKRGIFDDETALQLLLVELATRPRAGAGRTAGAASPRRG